MSDEASPENIPFTLTKAEGGQEWTLETDADGIILFEELEPGVYTLVEDVPEGYLTSLDETNNTITVTASDDPVEVLVTNEKINPSITVTKIAEPETVTVGDPITYRYTVTNDGNVTLTEVTLVDDMFQDPIELSVEERDWDGTLEPGEIAEGEAEYVADKVGILTNTATATGYYNGTAYSGTDTVGVEVLEGPPEPGIKITKDADKEWAKKGEWIKYTYEVKNTGNVGLWFIVKDNKLGVINNKFLGVPIPGYVKAGDTQTLTKWYKVTGKEPDELKNTATVTGWWREGCFDWEEVRDSDSETVNIAKPGITVVKEPHQDSVVAGQDINYSYTVTNTGNVPLTNVTLVDDKLGSITLTGLGDDDSLDPGESATGSGTAKDVSVGIVKNTATANDDGDDDRELPGTITAVVEAAEDEGQEQSRKSL
jgi:hypothetical protein